MMRGLPYAEIAETHRRDASPRRIAETPGANLLRKLDLRTSAGSTLYAAQHSLIDPNQG
jgi:hypothetical protein